MASSSSSSAAVSLLTTCMSKVLSADLEYGACLMNSGFFEVVSTTRSSREDLARFAAALASNASTASAAFVTSLIASNRAGNVMFGQCQLRCSAPTTLGASASCCRAVSSAKSCRTSNPALAQCSSIFDDTLALHGQCALTASNIGLIVAAVVVVALVVALMVVTRRFARKRAQHDDLEARLAAGTLSRWHAMLSAWQQVTNLVWKNWVLRRRHPVALVMEQLLPVLLVTGLVFIANLETIFPSTSTQTRRAMSTEAYVPKSNEVVICSGLETLREADIGAPNDTQTTFYSSGQTVLGMFLLISYIKFVSTTTTTMVIEKETRIREIMKIMGLSDLTLLLSWIVTCAVLSTPLAFGIAAELKFGNVFPVAEYSTLVFLFWSFSLSIVAFSYFITPFFDKSRTASIASVLLWIILYFPFFSVQAKVNSTKYTAALSPPTAFALAVDELLRRAQLGKGFAYSLAVLQNPITVPSAFSMSWMLMLDSCLLFLLGWYLEQVLPQQYGVRKPWDFCFKQSFWFPAKATETPNQLVVSPQSYPSPRGNFNSVQDESEVDGVLSSDGSVIFLKQQSSLPTDIVEPVPTALAAQEAKGTCLQIRRLRKVFQVDDGEKVAVHELDLTFYSGQITALLGHNGAGKTTTISMLTGLIAPTSGDATLFGRSIRSDFNELRQIMGICPQHDVLFNDMTVEEHLRLFGTMKKVPSHKLQLEVDKMIQEVGLTEKRRVLSKNLSGGQKRKLSVAIAFIGDSKLVFLDEPTSGMDPYSRRFTWNLLQRNREDRVIVLTTHFMDEADILGDRIAIMADGQLCCLTARADDDDDVAAERMKVLRSQPGRNDSIFIRNLRQQYSGGKIALDDLCLTIPKGECFGYLGINGAGKSTTMKILTGLIAPSNGFVTLGGYDLSRDRDKARTVIGYCPQFDSLHDLLTVQEQLELYARLKGIPRSMVAEAVDQKIEEVGLSEYRDKLTRGLSGGNKRKVSTAIALMGSPRIIFLDEPSTGVDPSSRRKMWDVIAAVCAEKESCVVLTTHSMEECEALCTRVGILVSGKLKCLGSVEHLKQKFGRGYTVEVKMSEPPEQMTQRAQEAVQSVIGSAGQITERNLELVCSALGDAKRAHIIKESEGNGWVLNSVLTANGSEFQGSQLVEHQGDHFRFQVPKQAIRPHTIFRLLEESKIRLHVNEYSVSDTSLEHIFNNMAAQQEEEQLISNETFDDREIGELGHDFNYELEPSSVQSVRSYHRNSSLRRSSFLE
ncbi:hypothetical protein ATCC90586_003403 [Pythium insidiosum]|nr:hypothetical protein ATCC90586_003403 [Pythium insidiosum]